jgi:hypothetical protein
MKIYKSHQQIDRKGQEPRRIQCGKQRGDGGMQMNIVEEGS